MIVVAELLEPHVSGHMRRAFLKHGWRKFQGYRGKPGYGNRGRGLGLKKVRGHPPWILENLLRLLFLYPRLLPEPLELASNHF